MNYYNEFDRNAAAWLRELIKEGHIPAGDVDERSIADVKAHELTNYIQHHFFSGIGGWSLALALAGWPADRPVVTGSCPCQPFSCAGKRKGTDDARHLWPAFRDILAILMPATAFGEQVASNDGRKWLAGVRSDLEALGYAVGAADLCAAGVAAPHIRQRLFWVADRTQQRCDGHADAQPGRRQPAAGNGTTGRMADAARHGEHGEHGDAGRPISTRHESKQELGQRGAACGVGNTESGGCGVSGDATQPGSSGHAIGSSWARCRIIPCRDGKSRRVPVEPALFPLAHGLPGRVGILRGAGNAIVPQVAATFIQAYMSTETHP